MNKSRSFLIREWTRTSRHLMDPDGVFARPMVRSRLEKRLRYGTSLACYESCCRLGFANGLDVWSGPTFHIQMASDLEPTEDRNMVFFKTFAKLRIS